MNSIDLMVVMPVYNEEESIEKVFNDWANELTKLDCRWKFVILDDGSTDRSYEILQRLKEKFPTNTTEQIEIQTQTNMGHGQSCLKAYKMAIEQNAAWTLQVDSDGQCNPKYLKEFWDKRSSESAVFGYRKTRDDGFSRWLISRVVSMVLLLGLGSWVKDANVPYRLIPLSLLKKTVEDVPKDFYLVNVLLSGRIQKLKHIRWIPIHFLDRHGGTPTVKAGSFVKQGGKLLLQLWRT